MEQPPDSWNIFWDPAYKNQYSLGAFEYLYNSNITALAMGYPYELINDFDTLNNTEFKKRLRALAENASTFWKGVDYAEDLEGLSFATSWGDSFSDLKRRGESWKMAEPVEGTMWWIDVYSLTWALTDKPFKKKVAEEWINKILSTDFQLEHLMREVQIFPVISNIEHMLTESEKIRLFPDLTDSVSGNRIIQQTYNQRDRNGLQLLWNEAIQGIYPDENVK